MILAELTQTELTGTWTAIVGTIVLPALAFIGRLLWKISNWAMDEGTELFKAHKHHLASLEAHQECEEKMVAELVKSNNILAKLMERVAVHLDVPADSADPIPIIPVKPSRQPR